MPASSKIGSLKPVSISLNSQRSIPSGGPGIA